MLTIIQLIHTICGFVFDLLYIPVQWMPPFYSLLIFSIITAIFFLWVYPFLSNQEKIQAYKQQIAANLLAVRLYQNDLSVFFSIQFKILYFTLRYMGTTLVPIMIMIIPLFFILSQLNRYYSLSPIPIGDTFLVKLHVEDETLMQNRETIQLQLPDGVIKETKAVFVPAENMVIWRLKAETEGIYELTVQAGNELIDKQISIATSSNGVSFIRTGNAIDLLLYPGEPMIPHQTGINSIETPHPEMIISLFGFTLHWVIWFTILTVVFGFLLKDWMGVQI